MKNLKIFIIVILVLYPVFSVEAQECATPEWQQAIYDTAKNFKGIWGMAYHNFKTGENFSVDGETRFPTASTIKFPVLISWMYERSEGKVDFDDSMTITDEYKVGGSGTLQDTTGEQNVTLREAIDLMISISDNTATNIVIDSQGDTFDERLATINNRIKSLGINKTELMNRLMAFDTKKKTPDSLRYGVGYTTPADMVKLLELVYNGEIIDRQSCGEIIDIMKKCKSTRMIPRFLPEGTQVAHKSGAVDDSRSDLGIVFSPAGDYAIAVYTDLLTDQSWDIGNEGLTLIANISKIVYDHVNGVE